MRDPELSYNILPNKSLGILVLDVIQWFSFNLLGEVICADLQVPLIPYGLRKRTYNIQGLDRGLRTSPSWWMFGANL